MLEGFITIPEASKLYGKDATTIRRKLRTKDWIMTRKRKVEVLEIGVDAFLIGNTWIVSKERLSEIYGRK